MGNWCLRKLFKKDESQYKQNLIQPYDIILSDVQQSGWEKIQLEKQKKKEQEEQDAEQQKQKQETEKQRVLDQKKLEEQRQKEQEVQEVEKQKQRVLDQKKLEEQRQKEQEEQEVEKQKQRVLDQKKLEEQRQKEQEEQEEQEEYIQWQNKNRQKNEIITQQIEVDDQEIFHLLEQPDNKLPLKDQQQQQQQKQDQFFVALKKKQKTKIVLNKNQPKSKLDFFKNSGKITQKEKPLLKYQFETQLKDSLVKLQESNQIVNPLSLVINQKIEADNPDVLFYVLGDQMRRQNKVFFKSLKSDENLLNSFQGIFTAESQDSQSFSLKLQETSNLSYTTIATDEQKREEFLKTVKQCLSIDLKVPEDQIQIVGLEQGSINVIYEIVKVNENAAKEEVIKTVPYNSSDSVPAFDELQKKFGSQCKPRLKIHDYFQTAGLSPDDFEPRYNMEWDQYKFGNYDQNGRGPRGKTQPYFFPVGWKGYGLKVAGKYDNGNDNWLMMNNNPEEWYVMFHGTKQQFCKGIKENGLKEGRGQAYSEKICLRTEEKIGTGVYFSNHIEVCENYRSAEPTNRDEHSSYAELTIIGEKQFRMAFQTRVKPSGLRQCRKESDLKEQIERFKLNNPSPDPSLNDMTLWDNDYFVVNNTEDIRPYRILLKEVKCRK